MIQKTHKWILFFFFLKEKKEFFFFLKKKRNCLSRKISLLSIMKSEASWGHLVAWDGWFSNRISPLTLQLPDNPEAWLAGKPVFRFSLPSFTMPNSLPVACYASGAPNTVTCLFRGRIRPLLLQPSKALWSALCCARMLKTESSSPLCFVALYPNWRAMGSFYIVYRI